MNSGRRSSANGKVRGTSRNSKQSLFTSMLYMPDEHFQEHLNRPG